MGPALDEICFEMRSKHIKSPLEIFDLVTFLYPGLRLSLGVSSRLEQVVRIRLIPSISQDVSSECFSTGQMNHQYFEDIVSSGVHTAWKRVHWLTIGGPATHITIIVDPVMKNHFLIRTS